MSLDTANQVAAVPVGADRPTRVVLVPVVQRYDGRVGDEGPTVAVLNDDGRSRKHETVLLNRPGVAKQRMIDRASERADRHTLAREHQAIHSGRHMRVLIVAIALVGFHALPGAAPSARRVLFIGNSLTAANNLPGMVEAIAAQRGGGIACEAIVFPGVSLEDHWNRGDAVRAIARGGWSTVVLQQGPSALPESRVLLRAYVRKFDQEVRRVGARTALYMVWPQASRSADFEGVRLSYSGAADEIGGLLLPAGDAWRAAWRRDSRLALYGPDGFHPSAIGTYLAALVIYQRISGRSPAGLPAALTSASGAFPSIAITQEQAALLQSAAVEANNFYGNAIGRGSAARPANEDGRGVGHERDR